MKVVTSGDGPPSEFLYDGKTIMEYLPTQNMVAQTEAPPALGAMLDEVYEKSGSTSRSFTTLSINRTRS